MIGYYKEKFPRGRVALRGWDPQNPVKQTIALPVAKDATEPTQHEWIWPGHIMFPTADGKSWTKTAPTGKPGIITVAQDASIDPDVTSANSLVGLACSDSFKLATPFFRRGTNDSYTMGLPLTYCAANENIDGTTVATGIGTAAGYIRPAAAGDVVIGYVCHVPTTPAETGINNSVNLQSDFVTAIDSQSIRENAYYVYWNTNYQIPAPTA